MDIVTYKLSQKYANKVAAEVSYTNLTNKPSINGVKLNENKTGSDYGLVNAETGKGLSTNDLTNTLKINYDTAYTNTHTHSNKSALDNVSGTNTGDETNSTIISKIGYTPENVANKGQALGYCGLDGGSKIPLANLPSTLLKYIGTWNANTNTPTLTNPDTTKKGNVYVVSISGTQFGISFKMGDWLIYNDSGVPEKSDNSDDVVSVNSKTGTVVLNTDDIPETATNMYVPTLPIENTQAKYLNGNKEWQEISIRHNQLRDLNGDSDYQHITNTLKTNYDTAYTNTHTHSNKSALDNVSGTNTGDQDLTNYYTKSQVDSKMPILITRANYDALVSAGTVQADRLYDIIEEV